MRSKWFVMFAFVLIASMVLSACAPAAAPAEPQVVEKTVIVAGTPQTVVVTATPAPAEPVAPVEFKSADPTTLVYQTFGDPDTLDPAYDYETAGGNVILNTYDFLVFPRRESVSDLVPMLATEVPSKENGGISEDGLTYTFKIRKGVKFHSGDELTPSDVAFTFQRNLLQGGTSSPQWLFVEPILGSSGYNDITDQLDPDGSKALVDDRAALSAQPAEELVKVCELVKSKIVADDAAGTVTFKLAQPWGPFLVTFTGGWGAIQNQKWVGANGGWDGDCATWQNFYGLVSDDLNKTALGSGENGTGPYILDHWTPKQEIVYKANENYWVTEPLWEGGPSGAPAIKTVIQKSVDEFSTRFAALQAGDADFVTAGSAADWPQMDTLVGEDCTTGECVPTETPEQPLRVFRNLNPVSRTDAYLTFNVNTEGGNNFIGSGQLDGNGIPANFFSDVHVRRAFAYCFDWETYIADALQGEGAQANTMMLPGEPGSDPDQAAYSYDPAKCEEEFKASELKSADGQSLWDIGFRMSIAYNTGNTSRQTVAQIFQNNLSAVNEKFVVEVIGLPWAAYLNAYRASKLPMFVTGWQEDIPDPHNWTFTMAGAGGAYSGRQKLPKEMLDLFAPLIQAGVAESDPAKRAEIYKELNQLYYENVPTILLATANGRHYQQRWVKNWYYNPSYSGTYYWYALAKD